MHPRKPNTGLLGTPQEIGSKHPDRCVEDILNEDRGGRFRPCQRKEIWARR